MKLVITLDLAAAALCCSIVLEVRMYRQHNSLQEMHNQYLEFS